VGKRHYVSNSRAARTKIPLVRFSVASVVEVILIIAAASPAYADCTDGNNNTNYCAYYNGCGSGTPNTDTFFAQVATQNGSCVWNRTARPWKGTCPYVYSTQGAKGNISTEGNPFIYSQHEHVLEWITAEERSSDCTTSMQTGAGCWVQVGWEVGYSTSCGGTIDTGGNRWVEVEIYDDSSAPCFLSTFGTAPTNASYDARYYTHLPNGLYRYQVYFEVPGSGNIQNLAYGDLKDQYTAELAAGEAHPYPEVPGALPYCPVLGQTPSGNWNFHGEPASQPTFASNMQLYIT